MLTDHGAGGSVCGRGARSFDTSLDFAFTEGEITFLWFSASWSFWLPAKLGPVSTIPCATVEFATNYAFHSDVQAFSFGLKRRGETATDRNG
jgi:hypothetical protein